MKAEEKMQSMKNRLNLLWNRLETPDQTREEFLADKVSLTQDTFTAVSNKFLYLNTDLIIPPPTFTEKKIYFSVQGTIFWIDGVIFMSVQKKTKQIKFLIRLFLLFLYLFSNAIKNDGIFFPSYYCTLFLLWCWSCQFLVS